MPASRRPSDPHELTAALNPTRVRTEIRYEVNDRFLEVLIMSIATSLGLHVRRNDRGSGIVITAYGDDARERVNEIINALAPQLDRDLAATTREFIRRALGQDVEISVPAIVR